ncbi:hypothetical protein BD414DRAFT_51843 [Trametes punicea]|nr:hypothetical protein BD414DRAFT_51843 [Trametes punicea]
MVCTPLDRQFTLEPLQPRPATLSFFSLVVPSPRIELGLGASAFLLAPSVCSSSVFRAHLLVVAPMWFCARASRVDLLAFQNPLFTLRGLLRRLRLECWTTGAQIVGRATRIIVPRVIDKSTTSRPAPLASLSGQQVVLLSVCPNVIRAHAFNHSRNARIARLLSSHPSCAARTGRRTRYRRFIVSLRYVLRPFCSSSRHVHAVLSSGAVFPLSAGPITQFGQPSPQFSCSLPGGLVRPKSLAEAWTRSCAHTLWLHIPPLRGLDANKSLLDTE